MRFITLLIALLIPLFAFAETRLRTFVILEGMTIGEVEIYFTDPKKDLTILRQDLEAVLGPILKDDRWERLARTLGASERVPLQELERIGSRAEFDEASLTLRLAIPLEHRRIKDLSIGSAFSRLGLELRSTPGSGYLNIAALVSHNDTTANTTANNTADRGWGPVQGQAELVQNLGPLTFESAGYFLERQQNPWERGDTALVGDSEMWQTRFRLGDSVPVTTGYMAGLASGGVHVFKQFSIDPTRPSSGRRSALLQITKSSLLEISVNRILITRIRVTPGPFNLRDLPLLNGRNRVQVRILDDFGGTEEFEVDLFFDGVLLGRGIHEYSYFAGRPWENLNRQREYKNEGFVSILHRVGVSDQVTLGFNAQGFRDSRLLGFETSWLTPLGTLQGDLALSRSNSTDSGTAERIRYRTNDQIDGILRRTRLLADYEHRSSKFSSLSLGGPNSQTIATRVEGLLQTRVTARSMVSYGGGYRWGQNGAEDTRFYRAGLQAWFANNVRTDLSYIRTMQSVPEDQILFTLTWSEVTGHYSSSLISDSLSGQTSASAHRAARRTNDDFTGDVAVQSGPGLKSVDLRSSYLSSYGDALIQHQGRWWESHRTNQSRAGLSTAIVWSGQHVALSRPIHDSYALLVTNEVPDQGKLVLNPGVSGSEAGMKSMDRLVLPYLSSYQMTPLRIDSTLLPPGYSLEREIYRLRPGYRSGVFVDLRLTKRIHTTGRLLTKGNQPLKYISGRILTASNQLVSESFFTDGEGRFQLDQLLPGSYFIRLREPQLKPILITIPDKSDLQFDLGDLKVVSEEGT